MDNRTLEEVRKNEDRLINELEQLQQENQSLKAKIKKYEDPEDLTLMFMYCDEKAKDKIKELQEQNKKYKEVIDKLNQINNLFPKTDFSHDYMIYRNKVEEILKEVD